MTRKFSRHYIGWYFLDDYADWLGQQEEQIADLLAMSPMTAPDGSMHLVAVVTEAKYIDATSLATKRRESHKQLRDTLRRVAGAVMETPARLDCAVWLARLSDLLVDGVMFPASASLDLPAWRRAVRERRCTIELLGYSHVFVSGPVDSSDCTERMRFPEADGTSFDAYQEVFGRDRVRELVLCYHRQGDPTGIRWDRGEDGWDGGSAPHGPNEQWPGPRGTASARGRHVPRDEDSQGRSSGLHEPDSQTEPDSAASGAGSILLGPPIGTPPRTSPIIGTTPGEVTHDQPQTSGVHEDDRRWAYPGVARWVAAAPARTGETTADLAWLRQIEGTTKIALHQFQLQAKLLRSVLTPNAALLKFQGSANLTVDQVVRRRLEFLTTYGLSLIGVQPEPGVVSLSIARPRREVVSLWTLWQRWTPDGRDGNQSLLIGVREDDGELLVLSPGEGHSPHTLIAGSTGSGKSVLMQNIVLSIVATNRPDQARITLVDPKQGVDYFSFEGLPHLDGGIIDRQEEALARIRRLVDEMDARYMRMRHARAANLQQYNVRVEPVERLQES